MPPVKNVGKPCAGEPHARFDGRELETEPTSRHGHGEERPYGKPRGHQWLRALKPINAPRQLPTLPLLIATCCEEAAESGAVVEPAGAGLVAASPPDPVQVVGFG